MGVIDPLPLLDSSDVYLIDDDVRYDVEAPMRTVTPPPPVMATSWDRYLLCGTNTGLYYCTKCGYAKLGPVPFCPQPDCDHRSWFRYHWDHTVHHERYEVYGKVAERVMASVSMFQFLELVGRLE